MSSPKTPSRRRFLRNSLDLGLVAVLASTFAGRALAADGTVATGSGSGSITKIKGQVFVNGKQASSATVVPINAEVRTGKRSMVAFTAGGDAHVLKANTSVSLSGSGGITDQLRLFTGALLSAWGERPDGRQAKLSSGTATIGIRGTVTFTTPSRFSLLQGKVEYTYKDKNGNTKTLSLARDETTGKPVSVDETGAKVDWVPPVTKEETAVLKETIKQAMVEVRAEAKAAAIAAGKEVPTDAEIEAEIAKDDKLTAMVNSLTQLDVLVQEVETKTTSGELKETLIEDIPTEEGGTGSPQ